MKRLKTYEGTVISDFNAKGYGNKTYEQHKEYYIGLPSWIIGRIEKEAVWNYNLTLPSLISRLVRHDS